MQPADQSSQSPVSVRAAEPADLPRLTEIYNFYVVNTPVTFDIEPYTVDARVAWLNQFATTGRYRLLVAEQDGSLLGYAGSTRFRVKAAYDPTVETTIYCAPEAVGRGVGKLLYSALFAAIAGEDIHRIVAGYTLPNLASAALHTRFRFDQVGIFRENGRKFGRYWDVAWNERPLHP
jgi:phosphinothricin acetyltransferase